MNIAVVSNMFPDKQHPSYGVFVKNFCNILDKLQIEYTTYVMLKRDSIIGKLFGYAKFYIKTALDLCVNRYDIIYVHYASHSSIPVLLARKIRKVPIFTNLHGSDVVPENKKQEKMQKYTKRILSISDKIIVPSEYFKQLVIEKYGLDEKRIFISPSGGVDNTVFYVEEKRKKNECLNLGYVGRISHKKGWDTLLKACSKLSIQYSLTVVGNGPEYKQMRDLARLLKIDDKIQWLDLQPQEQLRKIYNAMDVFVFPTEREGESLGLVAIEALACGTPVIASDFAAPKYYIVDGENGFKFSKGDVDDLAAAIKRFDAMSFEERDFMRINALNVAKEYHNSNLINGMEKILKTM